MNTVLLQNTGGFEFNDGWRVSGMLVGVDDPRRRMVLSAQGFGEETFGRRFIAFSQRSKSIVTPVESRARYKYTHLPLSRMYFVHPPTIVSRSELRSQSALNFRAVTFDPPPDGDAIGAQAPLGQQLLHITIREREAQIPTTARRITSGSNWRHLSRPHIEESEEHPTSLSPGLQSCNTSGQIEDSVPSRRARGRGRCHRGASAHCPVADVLEALGLDDSHRSAIRVKP